MKISFICAFSFLTMTFPGFSAGGLTTLQNSNGKELKAYLELSSKPNSITLRRSDGKTYRDVPLSSFSADSQKVIQSWIAGAAERLQNAEVQKDSRLKVFFARKKSNKPNQYGDIDDRVIRINPRVVIENEEREKTFRDVECDVIVIAKGKVEKNKYAIIVKERIKLTVEPKSNFTWEGEEVTFAYDPDYGGYDFGGYLVVLNNKEGKPAMVKASSPYWEKSLEAILRARTLTNYDREFRSELKMRSTWGLPTRTR